MAERKFTQEEIVSLCEEMSLLMHAGVGTADGFAWLAEQDAGKDVKQCLQSIADDIDGGLTMTEAVQKADRFPVYMTGLIEVGEQSGRSEQAMRSISDYYANRIRTEKKIRSAFLYPSVLLILMLVVIVVLLAKVLPMFNEVYASLGSSLTGVAGGLLVVGRVLDAAMPVLCVILGIIVICMIVFFASGRVRSRIFAAYSHKFGDKGVSRKFADAHIAQAIEMSIKSGLSMDDSIGLARKLVQDNPGAVKRCDDCTQAITNGEETAEAFRKTGLLPPAQCRLLALGLRSGTSDTTMEEISRRLSEEADDAVEGMVSKIEPALVLSTSILVGAILLSVMLPLMNIMAAIG